VTPTDRGRDICVVGFSDGRGPADANGDSAAARAEAVTENLMQALGGDLPFNVGLATDGLRTGDADGL